MSAWRHPWPSGAFARENDSTGTRLRALTGFPRTGSALYTRTAIVMQWPHSRRSSVAAVDRDPGVAGDVRRPPVALGLHGGLGGPRVPGRRGGGLPDGVAWNLVSYWPPCRYPSILPASTYRGPRPGYVFTTRQGYAPSEPPVTGYHIDW